MNSILSALAAIAVYSRICELGHPNAAVVCGIIMGVLARRVLSGIAEKKSAGAKTPSGQTHK